VSSPAAVTEADQVDAIPRHAVSMPVRVLVTGAGGFIGHHVASTTAPRTPADGILAGIAR
jgi:FlaA1/EpsC-like NDP-sugar epimerase